MTQKTIVSENLLLRLKSREEKENLEERVIFDRNPCISEFVDKEVKEKYG